MDAANYYATFGPSIAVEPWLHTTYQKRILVEARYDVGLTPNPAVCTNTGAWSGI